MNKMDHVIMKPLSEIVKKTDIQSMEPVLESTQSAEKNAKHIPLTGGDEEIDVISLNGVEEVDVIDLTGSDDEDNDDIPLTGDIETYFSHHMNDDTGADVESSPEYYSSCFGYGKRRKYVEKSPEYCPDVSEETSWYHRRLKEMQNDPKFDRFFNTRSSERPDDCDEEPLNNHNAPAMSGEMMAQNEENSPEFNPDGTYPTYMCGKPEFGYITEAK